MESSNWIIGSCRVDKEWLKKAIEEKFGDKFIKKCGVCGSRIEGKVEYRNNQPVCLRCK